jgi:hypothetical protein
MNNPFYSPADKSVEANTYRRGYQTGWNEALVVLVDRITRTMPDDKQWISDGIDSIARELKK